jgi:transcriptional regulator with XRE-family HTH domain
MAKKVKDLNPVDRQVGTRVRMRRLMLGMSQETLAHGLGITFQQVQKYEKGRNRISASRLQRIADILQVPISFFFENLDAPGTKQATAPSYVSDFLASSDGLALTKAFMTIRDNRVRRCIVDLVEATAR